MNPAIENMLSRRSVRSFIDKEIPEEYLDQILECGLYAANGRGWQSAMMVLIKDKDVIAELSKMNAEVMGAASDPFFGAPYVIIVLADPANRTYIEDGSLVMGNMMNAAHSLGIGSCWIHRAKQMMESERGMELKKIWGVDPSYVGIGNLILGYTESEPVAAPRKEGRILKV